MNPTDPTTNPMGQAPTAPVAADPNAVPTVEPASEAPVMPGVMPGVTPGVGAPGGTTPPVAPAM